MSEERAKRKLTAIFSADVEGYSRLMADNEEATVRTINAYREVTTGLIMDLQGRVVDAKGDNILAEFPSVVDAVRCAVQVQKTLGERNSVLPEHRRMEFRVGINLGDVIDEGGTIYGDGVNVAARLESLADGGGICISGTAFDQVKNRISVGFEYKGKQSVKNIPDPVRIYKVLLDEKHAGKVIGEEEPKPTKKRWTGIALAAVLLLAAGVLIWNFYLRPELGPASVEKMAFPLPVKPSIAVLPFANMSGDPGQEFLADGITENMITVLSKSPRLFVIARNSTFAYKGKPVKVQQVAEDLGVRYVLEGSISRSGERIRVTAQLIDALKGYHLWAERYDRQLKDVFALQDDLARKIMRGIGLKLTLGEESLHGRGAKNFEVDLKLWQGISYLRAFNIDDNNRARLIAEECMALEPDFWGNYWFLGAVHMMDFFLGSTRDPARSLQTAIDYLEKAVTLSDDSKGRVYPQLGFLYAIKKDYGKAIELGEKAIDLVPNGADAHAWLAMSLTFAGRAQEALPLFEKAMRLNPLPPAFYYLNFGHALSYVGRLEEAVSMYKKTTYLTPNNILAYISLAAIYGMMGREEEAKAAGAEVLRINPKWSIEYYMKTSASKGRERFVEGLRKAGLPEHAPLLLPDKPSIAVLPFVNMSDDPDQEYFSDGITEEIITALSKTPKLFVIARNSSFTFKGKSVKVQQVGRELGVKYVLEGSVRKSEDKVRITSQLVDAQTGHHLWAERYDRELKDVFAVQDEITKKIITELQVQLTSGEESRLWSRGTDNLEAYLKYLQGLEHKTHFNKEENEQTRRMAKEAIALDPEYSHAYALLGLTHMMDVWLKNTKSPQESILRAIELAQKAIVLDPSNAAAYGMLGFLLTMSGQHEKGIAAGEKAVRLDPNSALAHQFLGLALRFGGRPKDAIPVIEKAIRLDPFAPSNYLFNLGLAYLFNGQHEKAIQLCKKATDQEPNNLGAHLALAVAYSVSGRDEEARAVAQDILKIEPEFSVEYFSKTLAYKNQEDKQSFITALRKASLR